MSGEIFGTSRSPAKAGVHLGSSETSDAVYSVRHVWTWAPAFAGDREEPGRWSFRRPAIRFLFLLPAMFAGIFPALLHVFRRGHDPRLLTILLVVATLGVSGYGLLVWKIVIEAHRRSGIGGLYGEER